MDAFQTSLLREKFTMTEVGLSDTPPVIALSNRMAVTFANDKGTERETFVIRTQNMHSCARLAAAMAREVAERGPISYRVSDFRWDYLWRDVVKGYEKDWNPDIWCAVYLNGRLIFSDGNHHNFLDIIEQCDAANKGEYVQALPFAEKIFQQAGKTVKIDYDSNVALIVAIKPEEAKCGIVLRGANKKSTFSFKALQRDAADADIVRVPTVLSICAAYLEAIQLAFQVGLLNRKYALKMIEKFSDDYRRMERATKRVGALNRACIQFDKDFSVTYRPERPDFQRQIGEAELAAAKFLKPPADDAEDSKTA